MKKISLIMFLIIGIMLSGCGVNSKTLKYAKDNGLNESLYSKVTIAGIGNKNIERAKFKNILKSELENHFNMYYEKICRVGTLNKLQYSNCMKQKVASKPNVLFTDTNKLSLSVTTSFITTKLMDVYIDKNILSYKLYKGEKQSFLKYNDSILNSSMKKYATNTVDFSFSSIDSKYLQKYKSSNQIKAITKDISYTKEIPIKTTINQQKIKINFPVDKYSKKKVVLNAKYYDIFKSSKFKKEYKEYHFSPIVITNIINNSGLISMNTRSTDKLKLRYIKMNKDGKTCEVIFNIDISIEGENIIFTYPKTYIYKGYTQLKPNELDDILKDSLKQFYSLNKLVFESYGRRTTVIAKLESKNTPQTVFTNIIMNTYPQDWKEYKEQSVHVKFEDRQLYVKLTVYPYKEHSKLSYSFDVHYKLSSKGPAKPSYLSFKNGTGVSTNSRDSMNLFIEKTKKEIEKIING